MALSAKREAGIVDLTESRPRVGRQPSSSRAELSHIAIELFDEHGFDETTIDDIAAAANVGRRTVFRYYSSKNELPWGEFEDLLARMRDYLGRIPEDIAIIDALRLAVLDFNRLPSEEIPFHRTRMRLLLEVPALAAHSTLKYAKWRGVLSEYVAVRLGVPEDSLEPQAMAWALLGVSVSAYEQWLLHKDADLQSLLESAYEMLATSFGSTSG